MCSFAMAGAWMQSGDMCTSMTGASWIEADSKSSPASYGAAKRSEPSPAEGILELVDGGS
jgi:hypothetical protein